MGVTWIFYVIVVLVFVLLNVYGFNDNCYLCKKIPYAHFFFGIIYFVLLILKRSTLKLLIDR